MTKQITPEILQRALDQERRGEQRPRRSALKKLVSKMYAKGNWLVVLGSAR